MNRDILGDISLCLEDADLCNFSLVDKQFNNSQTDYVWQQRFGRIEDPVTTSADGNFKQRYIRERELERTQKWLEGFGSRYKYTKQGLVNLDELYLYNKIKDISPLSPLINLKKLSLANNKIEDVSPLSTLINLKKLYLSGNNIKHISPLSSLIN